MEYIGIDVHKRESQVCVLAEAGEVVLERRVGTHRERFAELLGQRPRVRVLLESSTESEWVARCLEGLGHEVIVANPNFAAMYATRSRRVKTDKRDARTLAEACRLGAYRPAYRVSDESQHLRAQVGARELLVRTRTRLNQPGGGPGEAAGAASQGRERGALRPASAGVGVGAEAVGAGGATAGGAGAGQ